MIINQKQRTQKNSAASTVCYVGSCFAPHSAHFFATRVTWYRVRQIQLFGDWRQATNLFGLKVVFTDIKRGENCC